MICSQKSIFECRPKAWIRVTGEDALAFLQGQFTNELRQPAFSAVYGLWLNQKGKVVADSHVLRSAEADFYVTSATSPAEEIEKRLQAYVIADDVTLADETAGVSGLVIGGPGCSELMKENFGAPPLVGRFVRHGEIMAFVGRRMRAEHYEIIGPVAALSAMRDRFLGSGCIKAAAEDMEFARIAAGIPSIPPDLGLGDLPNEGGLEETAISFTKGCYLGQEVMSRLKNLGQVRRRLHVVRGSGPPPPPSAALFQDGRRIGDIRSVATSGTEFVALAMLSLINLKPTDGLSLAVDGPSALQIGPPG